MRNQHNDKQIKRPAGERVEKEKSFSAIQWPLSPLHFGRLFFKGRRVKRVSSVFGFRVYNLIIMKGEHYESGDILQGINIQPEG